MKGPLGRGRAAAGWIVAIASAGLLSTIAPRADAAAATTTTAASRPDFTGVWTRDASFLAPGRTLDPALYRSPYKERYLANIAASERGSFDLGANCQPPGAVRTGEIGLFEIIAAPAGRITIIYEFMSQVRRLKLGATQPEHVDPTVNGHSVAQWEGNTLVVDTRGISEFVYLHRNGGPHSDQLRTVERFSSPGKDLLDIEMSVIDDEALLRPWVSSTRYRRVPDGELIDYECNENPRNPINPDGSVGFEFQQTPRS